MLEYKADFMKKLLSIFFFFCLCQFSGFAQYVTIPDYNFRFYLKSKYPTCFNAVNMMDTTCPAILNESILTISGNINSPIYNIDGIQYFKNITELNCNSLSINTLPSLPAGLLKLTCASTNLSILPPLPSGLENLNCRNNNLSTLPNLPNSIKYIDCKNNTITTLPNLPAELLSLKCEFNSLTNLPILPPKLLFLTCNNNSISYIPNFPDSLKSLECQENLLTSLPPLPNTINYLRIIKNKLTTLPNIPSQLTIFWCYDNMLSSLPPLPVNLKTFECYNNLLTSLPSLPPSLETLRCSGNLLTSLPSLPNGLVFIKCNTNKLTGLPTLPTSLYYLMCDRNEISSLPVLPQSLQYLYCAFNKISTIPNLPNSLRELNVGVNPNLKCLPKLIPILKLAYDTSTIKCIPNNADNLRLYSFLESDSTNMSYDNHTVTISPFFRTVSVNKYCNPTNNPNQCISYPYVSGKIYRDINSNNIKDANEQYAANIKVHLKPNNYAYTNVQGKYELVADTIGAATLTVTPPLYYNVVPPTVAYNFTAFNNAISQTDIALQPNSTKDSIKISLTPINWAARPGFIYPYLINYENVGTTQLSANFTFSFNDTLLVYDSSSRIGVLNPTVNTLNYSTPTMVQGQRESWIAYFRVKTTAALGKLLKAKAIVSYNTFSTVDSISSIIQGSYDPNDKKATQQLTPLEVSEGSFIDYTVRFQNTGTDTAFTVVLADTLSSLLQASTLQTVEASHSCKTTVKDNVVFFEFLNIDLPDSNRNKIGSNGFVRFRAKPVSSVVNGNIISNKVAIYFDYNSPIITNTATTQILNPPVLPLKLLALSAIASQNNQYALVYFNTANELNTLNFDIEGSTNGLQFTKLASISSIGNGNQNYYVMLPRSTVNGLPVNTMHVRVKIIDKDGSLSYSWVVQVHFGKAKTNWEVVTNPAKGILNILVSNNITNNFNKAQIISSNGNIVKTFELKQGLQSIDITKLSAGIYYLQSSLGTKQFVLVK